MRRLLLLLLITFLFSGSVYGQIYSNQYRPFGQNWQELKTEHFRIFFPAQSQSIAYKSARILELQYSGIQELVGGDLYNFPFILNAENDLSNGFVTPLNFRSEVEIPPIKGKTMNPRSGDWLELVLPHELVHALHMNVNPPSLSTLVGIFSPDIRRSIHTAAPLGVFEGIAVEHETHGVLDGGGRGNHPFFTNRFTSNFASSNRWSMGQLIHVSDNTLPFDRHYIGGYRFTHWLLNRFGKETIKEAIDYHYKWPIFGFGFALRRKTGQWPASLYRDFTEHIEGIETQRVASLGESNLESAFKPHISQKGPEIRRPLWLDNETLLFHGRFYNASTGFYIYRLPEDELELIFEHRTVEDFRFSIDQKNNLLYFSDYVASGKYDRTFNANLFSFDFETEEITRITRNKRVFAPAAGHPFMALQTAGSGNRLVSVNTESGEVNTIVQPGPLETIEEIAHHPASKNISAVIAKKGSIQALWIVDTDRIGSFLDHGPDIVFSNGSVYDLDWHPREFKLLFSSDHTGTMNIYEYDHQKHSVRQITNSHYNAFEASYSPDGNNIAFIYQQQNKNYPAILQKEYYYNRDLPEDLWGNTFHKTEKMERNLLDTDEKPDESQWQHEPYNSGLSWLRPRTILPYYEQPVEGIRDAGVQLLTTDPMNRHTYSLLLSGSQNRIWHDLEYEYSGFYPGFGFNLFNRPSFPLIRDADRELDEPERFLLQNRGAGVYVPFRYTFRQNTRLTSFRFTPSYEIGQVRFLSFGGTSAALTDYSNLHSINLSTVLNFRLRQFRRDFQPNKGWILFIRTDMDLNSIDFDFEINQNRFSGRFSDRRGLHSGIFSYLAPLKTWNQSLRIGTQFITQTRPGVFNTQSIISNAFTDDVFLTSNNIATLGTRYTIPVAYPDDGGFLLPVYLSNLYVVLFSQTVGNLNEPGPGSIVNNSRTALGAGIRSRFRLSNLTIDIGIGLGYEPSRNQWSLIIGQF